MDGLLSTAAQRIVDQGLLGIFLVGITYAYWLRDKAYIAQLQARAEDVKALTLALAEVASVMRRSTEAQEAAAQGSRELAETLREDIPALIRAALTERGMRP